MFAFLQLMHFVVWVFFLPRYAPAAARAFDARVPWLRGWRAWALGIVVGILLLTLFVVDYGQGRTVYSALASYHAYLELPILMAMLIGLGGMRRLRLCARTACRPLHHPRCALSTGAALFVVHRRSNAEHSGRARVSALDELVQILREVVANPVETSDLTAPSEIRSQVDGPAPADIREKYQELLQRAVSLQK